MTKGYRTSICRATYPADEAVWLSVQINLQFLIIMNPERKNPLNALLKEWQPQADLPPRFESEVWRRIALPQEKPARWLNFDWLFQITL